MRPPSSGKSALARSTTRGDSGIFPLNHGLTVWRSEEATSAGCGAIRARMWSDTTASAVASPRGASVTNVAPLPSISASATDAAIAIQVGRAGARDARAQAGGRRGNRKLRAQRALQRLDAVALGRERRILLDARRERAGVGGVELAVDIGVDEQFFVFVHGHGSSLVIIVINRCRARASRDITVPIGTPVTLAISL